MGARDINCLALVQVEAPSQQKTPKFNKSHKIRKNMKDLDLGLTL